MEPYLVATQQSIEYQSSIGHLVAWERVGLLHRTRISSPSLAQAWKFRVVARPVRRAERVLGANECRGRMGKIIVH
jgi:hypothetical protein